MRSRRNLAIKEIRNKRYFVDKGLNVAAPRHVFKHMREEHAISLCERGELGLGPLNYYTTIENENIRSDMPFARQFPFDIVKPQ
jgi:hypothetical protein